MQYNLLQSVSDITAIIAAIQNDSTDAEALYAEAFSNIEPSSAELTNNNDLAPPSEDIADNKANNEDIQNLEENIYEAEEVVAEENTEDEPVEETDVEDAPDYIEVAEVQGFDALFSGETVLINDGLDYIVENIDEDDEHGFNKDFFTILVDEQNILAGMNNDSNEDPNSGFTPPPLDDTNPDGDTGDSYSFDDDLVIITASNSSYDNGPGQSTQTLPGSDPVLGGSPLNLGDILV